MVSPRPISDTDGLSVSQTKRNVGVVETMDGEDDFDWKFYLADDDEYVFDESDVTQGNQRNMGRIWFENPIDDGVERILLDRHGHQLANIECGEGYDDLYSCPLIPRLSLVLFQIYDSAFTGGSFVHAAQDAIKLQLKHFLKDISSAASNRTLRSYMNLYTSISIGKLGPLTSKDDFLSSLLAVKYKMHQLEATDSEVQDVDSSDSVSSVDGKLEMAMDIHFYINDCIIHIDEEEKQNRFENFFMSQITQNNDILRDVQKIVL